MKRKIFSTLFALVLALSLSMVAAVPVSASDVTDVTVTNVPETVSTAATYTIDFTTHSGLVTPTSTITITFPDGTTVPDGTADYDTYVTVEGTTCPDNTVTGDTRVVVVDVPANIPAETPVTVVIDAEAGITNPGTPAASDWTLTVFTSAELFPVESATYSTVEAPVPPAVTSVDPPSALQETTLDVIITGTGFTGATVVTFTVAETTVTVNSFTADNATQITAGITTGTITTTTLGKVVVTTPSGSSTATNNFSVGKGPGLVDVYNASLYVGSNDTITLAIGAASSGYTLVAHAATYEEFVVIGKSITLESMDGPATTIIDASAKADPDPDQARAKEVVVCDKSS